MDAGSATGPPVWTAAVWAGARDGEAAGEVPITARSHSWMQTAIASRPPPPLYAAPTFSKAAPRGRSDAEAFSDARRKQGWWRYGRQRTRLRPCHRLALWRRPARLGSRATRVACRRARLAGMRWRAAARSRRSSRGSSEAERRAFRRLAQDRSSYARTFASGSPAFLG